MDWFPDWSGATCAILACGPSGTREEVEKVRGLNLIVINCAWQFAPWADVLYACDPKWWRHDAKTYGQHALKAFAGLKVSQRNGHEGFQHPDVYLVELRRENDLILERGVIGSGHNSGFQALNLAVQFGARRILLLGYDMHMNNGLHSHRDHPADMGNPNHTSWQRYMSAFGQAQQKLGHVEVINCTPGSALQTFPRMNVETALEETGEWQLSE